MIEKNIKLMEMVIVLFINEIIDTNEKEDFLNRIDHKNEREKK